MYYVTVNLLNIYLNEFLFFITHLESLIIQENSKPCIGQTMIPKRVTKSITCSTLQFAVGR